MRFEDLKIGEEFVIEIPRSVFRKISPTRFRSIVNGVSFQARDRDEGMYRRIDTPASRTQSTTSEDKTHEHQP